MMGLTTLLQGFMTLTTPTDEDIYARLSPELRRQFDREREKRRRDNDAALQQVFDQRNLDRPAWRTDVPDAMRQAKNGGEEKQKQRIPMSVDSEVPEHERHVSR